MMLPLALMLLACGDKDGPGLQLDDDSDGFLADEDCDDNDPSVHPDAAETCNGVDDDCDGIIDDNPADGEIWHEDKDGDGFGDPVAIDQECERPEGYVLDGTDCDDRDADVFPGADERCNEVDDDCDDDIDEDPVDAPTWHPDLDEDGYGDGTAPIDACTAPEGHVADGTDCLDSDGSIHPDADEICDEIDQDCDDEIDEDAIDGTTFYDDGDSDGFGDDSTAQVRCDDGGGVLVEVGGDCDDDDGSVYPDAPELCGDGQVNACADSPDDAAAECGGWGDPVLPGDAQASWDGSGALGVSLASAGDLDGDGDTDLLVGAPLDSSGAGVVAVVSMPLSSDQLLDDAVWVVGDDTRTGLGAAVSALGDIDRDGFGDFLVAGTDGNQGDRGIVYLLGGGASSYSLPDAARATWTGEAEGDLAGVQALAALGDITDDGVPDFLVGARLGSAGGTLAGQAYVVSGSASGSNSLADATARLYATSSYGFACATVHGPGDLDGDGVPDIVVEGTGDVAWLVFGPVSGQLDVQADADLRITDDDSGDLGAVDSLDVDGDGTVDLLLSVPADSTAATYGGGAWLHLGPWTADVALGDGALAVQGTTSNAFLGGALALVDDLDGDGQADMVLGTGSAVIDDDGLTGLGGTGDALVFSGVGSRGGAVTDADADIVFAGTGSFGMTLAPVGDLDGDSRSDLLIADPEAGDVWLFQADIRY